MVINDNIKDFFDKVQIVAFSTSDKNGMPNVVPIGAKKIFSNDTILAIDTYHNKTKENILQNPNVAIAVWKDFEGYQIKGVANYYTEGEIFEEGKEWILQFKPKKIVKGVILIKVTEIFYVTPNYEKAGKKI